MSRKPSAKTPAKPRAQTATKAGNKPAGKPDASGMPLKERAYQLIKHRILTCAFKPGEVLNEAVVADLFKLGRTPVNQAFDRLRRDALVDVIPRKGIVVRPIQLDEVLQISEARILNEAYAVRLAVERASTAEISDMRDVLAEAARLDDDIERFIMLDREFHLMIAAAARNEVLADILLNLNERSLRLWSISLADEAHKANVNQEHRDIFMALFQRDAKSAEQAVLRHVDSFRRTILQKLSDLQGDLAPDQPASATRRRSLSLPG